jgi:hypothetical protein
VPLSQRPPTSVTAASGAGPSFGPAILGSPLTQPGRLVLGSPMPQLVAEGAIALTLPSLQIAASGQLVWQGAAALGLPSLQIVAGGRVQGVPPPLQRIVVVPDTGVLTGAAVALGAQSPGQAIAVLDPPIHPGSARRTR